MPGRDGRLSSQIVEREIGVVISRMHQVTRDGEVAHQHKNQIRENGAVRQFLDEWTGTKTINAPYENHPPSFARDPVRRGTRY